MKRAVICVPDPWNYIKQYSNYSLMIINPDESESRKKYLLDNADWSILVTPGKVHKRRGADYLNEKIVLYTSGTTGDSKFFGFSAEKVQHTIKTVINEYRLTDNDRYLSVMPLWHAHGLLMYLAAVQVGCEIKIIKFNDLRNQIDFQPTYISAIPDFLKLALKQDFTTLRFIRSASAALPDAFYDSLKEKFKVPVLEAFGMTETCSHCITNPLHSEQKKGTVGLPSGVEIEINETKLYIRSPAAYTEEWFDTGDLAEQDSQGYIKILGRSIDRINLHGYKLDPVSIENQLRNRIADIGEVYLFGEDRVMCIYTGPVDVDLVKQEMLDISKYCNPKFLQQVATVPKNAVGKVSRKLLKGMYE